MKQAKPLDIALEYAKRGIKVFPCDVATKKPLTRNGFKAATTCSRSIRRWWTNTPDALIGGVCDGAFTVIDIDLKKGGKAYESMAAIHQYIGSCNARVTTPSNGAHYYFHHDPEITRKLGVLYSIDILGRGGYVILPDNSRYIQSGSIDDFISKIASHDLEYFPDELKAHILGEEELPALKALKEANTIKRTPSRSAEESIPKEDKSEATLRAIIEDHKAIEGERVYERSDKQKKARRYEFNGEPIRLEWNSLTTADMNGLFYNKQIQKRLAVFMGIPVPTNNGRSGAFRSLLPTHDDRNPSMGARWCGKGDEAHLVVRDFSDHYGNGKVDYNLVRLYAAMHYNESMTHLTGTLFCVWMLKLLDDAGVIEVDYPTFASEHYKMTASEKKVADGFLRLMAYKMLRKDAELETTFSQKFAAAWTGVSQAIVNSAKGKMIKFGNIVKTGLYHGTGMMKTAILRLGDAVILKNEIRSIGELNFAIKMMLQKKMRDLGVSSVELFKRGFGRKKGLNTVNAQMVDEVDKRGPDEPTEERRKRKFNPISGIDCVWDGS